MGLLDMVSGAMGGGAPGGAGNPALLQEAMNLLGHSSGTGGGGGLVGLLDKFRGAGLGHLVDGWVSNGPNPPATAQHVQSALGNEQVAQIASRLGVPPQQAASGLAAILPHLVDHLTPNGSMPDASSMSGMLQGLKGKLLGS